MLSSRRALVTMVLLLPGGAARAQPAADDGYCDFVQGAAAATAATLEAPTVFGQFGYIEQPSFGVNPDADTNNARVLAGVRYSFTNLWAGSVTKARAAAECRRHNAIQNLRASSSARALAARIQVYEQAQAEADRILTTINTELEARRATLPEATATRLRVEDLRAQLAAARRELASLPPPDERPLGSLLGTFRGADADVERHEGKLRKIQAYDVGVRVGIDRFVEGPNTDTRFFAVVQVGVNLGALWLGSGNQRAAAGRARYAQSGRDPLTVDATAEQLRQMLEVDTQRLAQTAALVTDLTQQLDALARLNSEESRRLRDTLWFEWVKARAEQAFAEAHVAALREVLGTTSAR